VKRFIEQIKQQEISTEQKNKLEVIAVANSRKIFFLMKKGSI
jgi:hypothetical protein